MIIIWIFIHGKTNEFPGLWLVNKNQQYFPNNLQNITQSKKGFSKGSHKTNGSIRESRHVYGSMRQTSPAISLLIRYWGRNIFHPPKAFSWGNCYLMNLTISIFRTLIIRFLILNPKPFLALKRSGGVGAFSTGVPIHYRTFHLGASSWLGRNHLAMQNGERRNFFRIFKLGVVPCIFREIISLSDWARISRKLCVCAKQIQGSWVIVLKCKSKNQHLLKNVVINCWVAKSS